METAEQVAKEYNVADYDAGNDRDKMFLGIITKLRGKNRELANNLETTTSKFEKLSDEVTTFRRTARENEIIGEVLGDGKEIADKAKFEKWKAKLTNGEDWEDNLKELVADHAVDKKSPATTTEEKKTPDNKEPEQKSEQKTEEVTTEEKKPGYTSRHVKGTTEEITSTAVKAPRTASERLRLLAEDPDSYEAWKNGRR